MSTDSESSIDWLESDQEDQESEQESEQEGSLQERDQNAPVQASPSSHQRTLKRQHSSHSCPPSTSHAEQLFAQKCRELQCYIPPLSLILNGLRSGRYRERLSTFQESVAMDRIQRIMGVLQNPSLGDKYTHILLKMEVMLKSWFPQVKLLEQPPATQTEEPVPSKKPKVQSPPEGQHCDSTAVKCLLLCRHRSTPGKEGLKAAVFIQRHWSGVRFTEQWLWRKCHFEAGSLEAQEKVIIDWNIPLPLINVALFLRLIWTHPPQHYYTLHSFHCSLHYFLEDDLSKK